MKRMYLSKMNTLQECTMKYYFRYKKCIDLKKEPKHFQLGRIFHSMCESYLKENIAASMRHLNIEPLSQEEKDLLVNMFGAPAKEDPTVSFQDILKLIKDNLLSSESLIELPIDRTWSWCIKVDASHIEGGTWMDEFKTASGYGPATAAYYHNSPQTWIYLFILRQVIPNLNGAKFRIVTKSKAPIVHNETIHLVKDRMNIAQRAVEEALWEATKVEEEHLYIRRGSKCKTHFQECEYLNICWAYDPIEDAPLEHSSMNYVEEVLNSLYVYKDPEAHLFPLAEEV